MREVKVPGLEITVPPNGAFMCETAKMMPKAHFLCAVVAARGYGKSAITTSFIEKLHCVDRLIVISPSAKSNKQLLDRLKTILKPEDVYEDPNDITILDQIIAKIDQERDDLENYLEKKKRYDRLMKGMKNESPLFRFNDDDLLASFDGRHFKPPEHKWGGRRPMVTIWCDDIFGSQLMLGRGARKISEICIKHRHLSPLKEGGAIGASLIFCMQSYKSNLGSLPKALRGNLTLLMLGKMKNDKDLQAVQEEVAGEVSKEVFYRIYNQAIDRPHAFLVIDMHPKKEHPSQFRRGLDTFIVVP
jgi:hypothetical protein